MDLSKKITIEKHLGETPLMALQRYVREHPEYEGLPATYAGRLDPMATGALILLFGEECKKKDQYLGLDKEYEVEILFGVESDTGDVLGMVKGESEKVKVEQEALEEVLRKEVGSFEREYPVFSSKTVNGKPLFLYALERTLDTISIPTHTETIYSIDLLDFGQISTENLRSRVEAMLAKAPVSDEPSKELGADFRIKDVRASWEEVWKTESHFPVIKVRVSCGSGAYMRTLVERVGNALGTSALALSIHRTKIG